MLFCDKADKAGKLSSGRKLSSFHKERIPHQLKGWSRITAVA